MMDYLKKYGITDKQIDVIIETLEDRDINLDMFKYDPEKIIAILDLFKSNGIVNFYEIIITSPEMFCDTVSSIKRRIDRYNDKFELARLINSDAKNLSLIGLL